jgi:hypothetical protein
VCRFPLPRFPKKTSLSLCSGPAKGYLSDLELKLHQMEALLGVILASNDPRAKSLITAISNDSVARDVLSRVDTSPVGTQPLQSQEIYNPRGGTSSVGRRIASELADSTREWQRHPGASLSPILNLFFIRVGEFAGACVSIPAGKYKFPCAEAHPSASSTRLKTLELPLGKPK